MKNKPASKQIAGARLQVPGGKAHAAKLKSQSPAFKSNDSWKGNYWWYLTGILILTAIIFSPILKNGFTNWDDPTYIEKNPLIKELSSQNIKRIFTEVYFANYQPLHILSYAIEYHFFKMNPAGYHAVSLIMHLINVILVFFFVRRLSDNTVVALITCLLFAVNPLRTESVAWVAERKDLLYSMFFFAALIFYLKYIKSTGSQSFQAKSSGNLITCFLFFVLSVFSKTMAVSLVPVLFLIDFYKGRKFTAKVILEKIPFIILALIMGLISVNASKEEGSIDTSENYSFIDRIFFAGDNLLQYIWKSVFPIHQSAYYQYPDKIGAGLPVNYYVSGLIIFGLAFLTFYSLKKGRQFFFSVTFFVVTVFLVLMLIPVGPTVFSERYSYIPSVALFFFITSVIYKIISEKRQFKSLTLGLTGCCVLIYSYITFERCKVWKDSVTLWNDVLDQFPKAPHALNNRGDAYFQLNMPGPAVEDFTAALRANNKYGQAYYNRGNAYGQMGKAKEAFADLNQAIILEPRNAEAYNKRGQANGVLGNFDAAVSDFNEALRLKPELTEVYFNLGITYLNADKKGLGCEYLKKAADAGFENAVKAYNEVCLK